jgi:tetratricopeptide (TPR) repeat protein
MLTERRRTSRELVQPRDVGELVRQGADALAVLDLDGARAAAQLALDQNPQDPAVHLLLGQVALARRRETEAEEHLRRALKLDAGLREAHRRLGDALALMGRFAEAVESWQRWLKLGARSSDQAPEVDRVQEAVHAAQTLDLLLRGNRA